MNEEGRIPNNLIFSNNWARPNERFQQSNNWALVRTINVFAQSTGIDFFEAHQFTKYGSTEYLAQINERRTMPITRSIDDHTWRTSHINISNCQAHDRSWHRGRSSPIIAKSTINRGIVTHVLTRVSNHSG